MNKTQLAAEVFNKHAEQYQAKFMDVSLYADALDKYLENIKKENAHILDIACGPGNVAKYMLSKKPNLVILGIDLAPNMLALAQANNPTAAFLQMDCRDISKLQQKFDGIMCAFALPYLSKKETEKLFADAYNLLQPGGVLYVSTMEGDDAMSGYQTSPSGETIYMQYHNEEHLTTALKNAGFSIESLQRKEIDLVILAGKR